MASLTPLVSLESPAPANFLSPPGNVIALRKLLSSRFPQMRFGIAPRKPKGVFPTGISALDRFTDGGLPEGEFTELVASGNGSGSVEVIHELLRQVALQRQFLALVDGMDSFDPGALAPPVLSRLLWVRCRTAAEALKAMDLLLRDRNFPMVVLDLKMNPMRELRRITSSIWFRYARLLERTQRTVLVITPQALVSVAAYRFSVNNSLDFETTARPHSELVSSLQFTLLRSAAELIETREAKAG
jgi:hypothetical protein